MQARPRTIPKAAAKASAAPAPAPAAAPAQETVEAPDVLYHTLSKYNEIYIFSNNTIMLTYDL